MKRKSTESVWAEKWAAKIWVDLHRAFDGKEADSQTYLAALLAFGLTDKPAEMLERLIETIHRADDHMECGIFGFKLLFNTLTNNGQFDLAWKMVMQTDYLGIIYMTRQSHGTLGSHWNGADSLNHHMFSSVGDWFYKGIAGIHLDETQPGFRHVYLRPHIPTGCGAFSAEYPTQFGLFTVSWNGQNLQVIVQEGMTATLTYKKTQAQRLTAGQHIF